MIEFLLAQAIPLCYYQSDDGTIVDLSNWCGRSQPAVFAPESVDRPEQQEDPRVTEARRIMLDPNADPMLRTRARSVVFWEDNIMPIVNRQRSFQEILGIEQEPNQ